MLLTVAKLWFDMSKNSDIPVNKEYKWHVLYVKHKHEFKVISEAKLFGISTYVPVCSVLRHWKDRDKWIEQPLFSGYVFVRTSCLEYYRLLNHPSVYGYVMFNRQPAVITQNQINAIRILEKERKDVAVSAMTEKEFSRGDCVKIVSGQLRGLEGIIEQLEGNRYLKIVIPAINAMLKVRVSGDSVSHHTTAPSVVSG